MKKTLIALLLLTFVAAFAGRAHAQVVVIANSSVSSVSVSKDELRDVFSGAASSFKDGSRVKPVILKDGPTHNAFLSEYLGRNPVTFLVAWRGLVMSGQATMPKTLDSESSMVDYVSRTSGAIGYVAKATPHDSVKELAVH